ncbi:hypothetical protein L209DRAFT_753855 [Thermothelomyces heterothallicus CBS 203.75]
MTPSRAGSGEISERETNPSWPQPLLVPVMCDVRRYRYCMYAPPTRLRHGQICSAC